MTKMQSFNIGFAMVYGITKENQQRSRKYASESRFSYRVAKKAWKKEFKAKKLYAYI